MHNTSIALLACLATNSSIYVASYTTLGLFNASTGNISVLAGAYDSVGSIADGYGSLAKFKYASAIQYTPDHKQLIIADLSLRLFNLTNSYVSTILESSVVDPVSIVFDSSSTNAYVSSMANDVIYIITWSTLSTTIFSGIYRKWIICDVNKQYNKLNRNIRLGR